MLHNFIMSSEEVQQTKKRQYIVNQPNDAIQPGDGVVITIEGTRDQVQAVVTDVNQLFKSKHIIALGIAQDTND